MSDHSCKKLAKEIEDLIRQSKETFITRNALEEKRNLLRTQLDTWRQDMSNVKSNCEMIESTVVPQIKSRMDMIQLEKKATEKYLANLKVRLDEIDLIIENALKNKVQGQAILENLITKGDELARMEQGHDEKLKELERIEVNLNKRAAVLQEEAALVPEPKDTHLIKQARDMTKKEIYSKLKSITKILEKFRERGIDVRMLENMKERCEKMDLLVKRLSAYQSDIERVNMLLDEIRMKRSQKVEFTYNQMKKNFKDIFAILVPGGVGGLSFSYPPERVSDSSSASSIASQHPPANEPIGIAFKVKFGASTGEPVSDMSQLSGGQKALIAIAFLLAVHRCDPVPFYVMDEIDAALDGDHRASVINLMSEQNDVQFICTTFQKEFILRSDHFIEVKNNGQGSRASSIDGMEEAMKVVGDNGLDENRDE